jgi:hypothetical protein
MAESESAPCEAAVPFSGEFAPDISLRDYLAWVCKRMGCSSRCLVLSLLYIDRLVRCRSGVVVNALTLHRLALTSLAVACKFHDDVPHGNAFVAKAGGVPLEDLNRWERQFLDLIAWRLYVEEGDFTLYREVLNAVAVASQ